MEQQLLGLLEQTQNTAAGPRGEAETQLAALYTNDAFPLGLANVASHLDVKLGVRQAALTTLRRYVNRCWSSGFEDFEGPPTNDEVKSHLRPLLLRLITDEQRKVRSISAAVVGKIATADFPEEWPTLLQDLLRLVTEGNESQTNGALHVLNDVLDEGLGEDQFIGVAKDIISVLYQITTDENVGTLFVSFPAAYSRKLYRALARRSLAVRSLAISTFKSCVDTLGILKGSHPAANDFAKECINHWVPFVTSVVESQLPPGRNEDVKGFVALKIQAIRVGLQVRIGLSSIFALHVERFFAAAYTDLNSVKDRYIQEFVVEEAEGRLVDGDNLPYSLDLYLLELIDFVDSCLKSQTIRNQLEQAGFGGGNSSPFSQMIFTAITLSQLASEDRSMWEIDLNVYLSEETQISANYTPRTAAGDLIIKLGELFPQQTTALLFDHTQRIFGSGESRHIKEAVLYLWDQLLTEFIENNKDIDHGTIQNLLGFVAAAIGSNEEGDQHLRARGYSVAATLAKGWYSVIAAQVPELVEQGIRASTTDPSDMVQITAIRVFQKYCDSVPDEVLRPYQAPVIAAVRHFLSHKSDDDPEDSQDVLSELVQTVNCTVVINYASVLDPSMQIPDLLFAIAGNGVINSHLLMMVKECFEEVCENALDFFVPWCEKLLPFVTQAMDRDAFGNEHPLMELGTEILAALVLNGSSPLPDGFVAAVMPKLSRILLKAQDSEVIGAGCDCLREIIKHDSNQQLSQWHDASGKASLEVVLVIIDRILRPDFAGGNPIVEIGGVAAEVADKFGDHLGKFLPELLRAVATRLATATDPRFIQSLVLVFARLVNKKARDVVDFLAGIDVGEYNGLEFVMQTWMANSSTFAGYDEIRENVAALCHLYNLQDPRLAQIMVQGDLIVPESNRIMTRSQAKQNPDQYTSVSVPMKIVKLLIQELGPNANETPRSFPGKIDVEDGDSEEEGWEDIQEGLGIPGITREELEALGASGRTSRQADDETYAALAEFFKEIHSKNIGNFQGLYTELNAEEQQQLSRLR